MTRPNLLAKQEQVKEVSKEISEYPVVGIVSLHKLPGKQLHDIKKKLHGKAKIKMTKKSTLIRSLDKKEDMKELENYVGGQSALLLSEINPFKLYALLQRNKSKASAKVGDVLPQDVTVSAGITNVAPGPAIGVFKKFNIQTKVTQGKIEVAKDKVIAKKGDEVTSDMVELFTMLGIEPMYVGLDMLAAYEEGTVYQKDVLSVSEEEYIEMIQRAYSGAFNLSVNAEIYLPENIETIIAKAVMNTKSVKSEANVEDQEENKSSESEEKEGTQESKEESAETSEEKKEETSEQSND